MIKPDYERGAVRLYLRDFREVVSDYADHSIDMVFCDPPYGHNNNDGDLIHMAEVALGKKTKAENARPIANDGAEEARDVFSAILRESKRLLSDGGCCCCCCCCGGGGPDPMFSRWSLEMDSVLSFKQMIVWDKGPMGLGWHYRRSYETVLVAQRDKSGKCKWYDDTNKIENIIRPGMRGIRKIIPSAAQHPTVKPVELSTFFIKLHTLPGEIVFDPCMGSGTTGISAVLTERGFVGCEVMPEFFGMAVRRIDKAFDKNELFEVNYE